MHWSINESVGDAGEFHARDPQAIRSVTFHTVDTTTLVLGSAQHDSDVDRRVTAALSADVVKRRSGGGAVLLLPGEFVWLDLMLPVGDGLWEDDVAKAMVWVGELWLRAFNELGLAAHVHTDALVESQWSRQVCFAGKGTGEVFTGERKLVGVSQRRTRDAARFQSMCHLRWRPELVAALVAAPRPLSTELATLVAIAEVDPGALRDALIRNLPDSIRR